MEAEWYGSITGIVAATIFLVSLCKRALGNVDLFRKMPTWLYAVVIAVSLTAFCVYVIETMTGSFWNLAWQAVSNAAVSSGIYEWVKHIDKPLEASARSSQS
jgi:hypothetical protein